MDAQSKYAVQNSGGRVTRILLTGGMAAGPLFLLTSLVQGPTRAGFNLAHQPISFLALGEWGWLQQANFILSGVLVAALATGMYRALRPSATGTLGALFLLGLSAGLIVAGLYPPDPGFGYPVGTPDGIPVHITNRSAMHGLGFMLSFGCFALACLVMAVRDMQIGSRREAAYTLLSATLALSLGMWPGITAIALRDLAAAALLFTWITVQALRLLLIRFPEP